MRGSGGPTLTGGVPTVGEFRVGGRATASTSTRDSVGLRSASSAGVNRHVRTARTTASVNGGVDRSTSTSVTAPPLETASDTMTSPPAVIITGTTGAAPDLNRAGSMSAWASNEIVSALIPAAVARYFM